MFMKNSIKKRRGGFRFAEPGTPVSQNVRFPQQHGPTPFGSHAATVRATAAAQAAAQAAHVSPRQSRKRRQSRSKSRTRNSSRRMSH